MRGLQLRALGIVILLAFASPGALALEIKNARVDFASVAEARQVLTTKDDFIEHLSAFDRSARMKDGRPQTDEEFLNFAGRSALAWTEAERKRLTIICHVLNSRLRAMPIPLPSRVLFIKTNGQEEGGSAYTRGTAIIIGQGQLAMADDLERMVCHELFHVISRNNPELRERLYAAIGFMKCKEAAFPLDLEARRITNPDAPRNDHFIRVTVDHQECAAVPILFSKIAPSDLDKHSFFEEVQFQFLVAENAADLARPDAPSRRLVEPNQLSGFFEQVGRNTSYIIHPEEILADNFALLVLRGVGPSPEVLEKIKAVLTNKASGA